MTRLLIRLGSPDLLDSVNKKLKTCLSIVNTSFDVHAQFTVLIRFINDNSSAPSVKAKEILLKYLQQIIQQMEPVDIANNADIRIALSKILNWSNEPKSLEMRKVENECFDRNTSSFQSIFFFRLHKVLFLHFIILIDRNLLSC